MKKLLNILYITRPEAYLSKDGMNVVVSIDQQEVFRIPIINIEGIVNFSYSGCSPGLMKLCTDNKVSLAFCTPNGKFIGRLQGSPTGNIILRKKQFIFTENEELTLHLSRLIIAAKIHNYRGILQRYTRDYQTTSTLNEAIDRLRIFQKHALTASHKGTLRGTEGLAAATYFAVLPQLITQQRETFIFKGRNKRPPKDAVNAMLSFVYTIMGNEIASALESVGLDPYNGVFHALRPGRVSLALDILEEFRAHFCDRFVLSLINRRQVTTSDFKKQSNEGILMTDNCRKIILSAWQNRKKDEIIHPFTKEKTPIGLLPYVQAVLLSRYLRGEMSEYMPFLIK